MSLTREDRDWIAAQPESVEVSLVTGLKKWPGLFEAHPDEMHTDKVSSQRTAANAIDPPIFPDSKKR
jgi:hypothetical protein